MVTKVGVNVLSLALMPGAHADGDAILVASGEEAGEGESGGLSPALSQQASRNTIVTSWITHTHTPSFLGNDLRELGSYILAIS